ncbi:DUF6879 family protein [Streptomyces sp. MP131-18]|uniref:DUF6879 family protein n=1 Tax=Streptomyces sp. MP131-18 TaxID=1857892 RepID=UPI00097BF712|nr:DUF6879 family protein [Streptomyces sp. MP131-18]ONK11460.1 hypothetical protein STBA_21920 [Streptomyces sp. MP131-18]
MGRRLSFADTDFGVQGVETEHVLARLRETCRADGVAQVQDWAACDEFAGVFETSETFEHTAWRLESRCRYQAAEQSAAYQRFVTGQRTGPGPAPEEPRGAGRRRQPALGRRVERVRVVDDPPTLGQLYLLDAARRNARAGEDVRNLWRADAEWLKLPGEDFWLFDSRVLAVLRFDDADRLTGIEVVTEPQEVLRACQVRDAAWHHAVPFEEFGARVRASD